MLILSFQAHELLAYGWYSGLWTPVVVDARP